MNTGTAANLHKVILDTNILISAVGFGGKPREILNLVLKKQIKAFTSPTLLAELEDVIHKKFPILSEDFNRLRRQIKKNFKIVRPKETIEVLKDTDDNRVLEAAIEGNCDYIITGDSELLGLNVYRKVEIITPEQFIKLLKET